MAEQQKEDTQKTVVSFVVGLLIGGLLVWAFSGTSDDIPKVDDKPDVITATTSTEQKSAETTSETKVEGDTTIATLPTGKGAVTVGGQGSNRTVALASATFPVKEGWVGVRDFDGGKLGGLLGVVRFSEVQGLVPTEIILQRGTVAGKEYAIVFYSENGDRKFNLADDVQIDNEFATFTAK